MQDRYAGDIGDFGKYGLLRALCGEDLRLGVLWYRVPDEKGNNDGRHTAYVHSRRGTSFEECDPELFAIMRTIVCGGTRSIAEVEKSGALPHDTLYFPRALKREPGSPPPSMQSRVPRSSLPIRTTDSRLRASVN